jgi:NADH-quinone oxidoreductase subunit I
MSSEPAKNPIDSSKDSYDAKPQPVGPDAVNWLSEPQIGFWEATFLPAIVEGLKTTIRHVIEHVTGAEKGRLPPVCGVHLEPRRAGRVKCVACHVPPLSTCVEIVAAPSGRIATSTQKSL